MMFVVEFSETITLGSILVVVGGAALALLFTLRVNSANTWRQEAEAQRARADRERDAKHTAQNELNALRLTKDITPVLESQHQLLERMVSMQEEGEHRYDLALKGVREMFADHEKRAQERHEAQLEVSHEIAKAIRKTTNGG